MRSAVTISLVPEARGGPFVFWEGLELGCEAAAELGFDAVEIFPPDARAIDVAATRAMLARSRLAVAAVATGGGSVRYGLTLTHVHPDIRRAAREFIRRIIDVAAEFEAPAIIGSMQGRHDAAVTLTEALAMLTEALEDLGEHASRRGLPLLFEPLNRYETNLFNRLGDTAEWFRTLHTRNIQILADLFHMNIEEADLAAALRGAGPLIGHVHFADSNRRAVGFGHTAIASVVAALRAIGYHGYLSAEVLPLPDSTTAGAQTMIAFRAATIAP